VNNVALRTLVIYAIIIPLAVFVGWTLSGDMTRTSFAAIAAILFVLMLPVLLKWHYPIMVFSWSTLISIFFLPGQPALWMLMAGITFGIAILNRIIQKQPAFFPAPSITLTLLALLAVIMITARIHGGMGVQALGDATHGGKKYYYIIAAVMGYFAFASRHIQVDHAKFYMGLYFLSALTSAGSTVIYWAGPSFYFLYLLFPIGFAAVQASAEYAGSISRVAGFASAGSGLVFFLLAAYGFRGLISKWWRLILVLTAIVFSFLGGYRSTSITIGLVILILFITEGLLKTSLFPVCLLLAGLSFALLIPLASHLPSSIQRSISFLPVRIDPAVRYEAQGTTEWRLLMWKALLPDLPKYFWVGKGFALNPTELYLTEMAVERRQISGYEGAIVTQDYHNGPLSVYVPFGVFGCLAFLAFLGASIRALYLNYRYGNGDLIVFNRFLFAYFCARTIFFFGAFGSLYSDLSVFTGTVGLGIALNKGICRKPIVSPQPVQFRRSLQLRAARSGAF